MAPGSWTFKMASLHHPAFLPHPGLGLWNKELTEFLAALFLGVPLAVPFLSAPFFLLFCLLRC